MKILVIDDDRNFLDAWVKLLRRHGHKVRPISDIESMTPEEANSKDFDLALIDRRAQRNWDEEDTSGENFALELQKLGTPAVLLTAFLPLDNKIFELLRNEDLTGIMSKNLDMEELVTSINQYDVNKQFPNCIAEFILKENENKIIGRKIWKLIFTRLEDVSNSKTPHIMEFSVLFRSIIPPCAIKVVLKSFAKGKGGAALVRAKVSSGDGPVEMDIAIKYGYKKCIKSETMRYYRHIGPLPDGVAAQIKGRAETKNLGALAYSWVGDSIEDGVPLGPIDPRSPITWKRRRSAISKLFSVSLNPWYKVYRERSLVLEPPQSLLEYYITGGGLRYKGMSSLHDLKLPAKGVKLPYEYKVELNEDKWNFGRYGRLINPVTWATTGKGSRLTYSLQSPCHGDLHVKNIYILPDDSPRLIDFDRTALGHVFRDFAALEVSIRLTCISDTDPEAIIEAENLVSEVDNLTQYINYRSMKKGSRDLKEAVRTTMEIRRLAADVTGRHHTKESIKEYLFTVLLYMLRYASGDADEIPKWSRKGRSKGIREWHALYGAAKAAQEADNINAA